MFNQNFSDKVYYLKNNIKYELFVTKLTTFLILR